jgi:hypothetical protein
LRHEGTGKDVDPWQRWDEELVEQFGRWLSRLVEVFVVLLVVIAAAVLIRWL